VSEFREPKHKPYETSTETCFTSETTPYVSEIRCTRCYRMDYKDYNRWNEIPKITKFDEENKVPFLKSLTGQMVSNLQSLLTTRMEIGTPYINLLRLMKRSLRWAIYASILALKYRHWDTLPENINQTCFRIKEHRSYKIKFSECQSDNIQCFSALSTQQYGSNRNRRIKRYI
jgi:hypothetical protein